MSISSHARRNAVIVANAYALPRYMTPELESRLGADMAETARREGHFARMPPSVVDKAIASRGGIASVQVRGARLDEGAQNRALILSKLTRERSYIDLQRLTGLSRDVLKKHLADMARSGQVIRGGTRSSAIWCPTDTGRGA